MQIDINKINFVLVGMPGSGKSTITRLFSELTGKQIINGDDYFDTILNNPQHLISQSFYKQNFESNSEDAFIQCTGSEQFIKTYGEDLFRSFEEFVNIYLLKQNKNNSSLLDLGGKVFIRNKIRKELHKLNYTAIYLQVDKDVLKNRLEKENAWSNRSTYRIAEEKGMGWKRLFDLDYKERHNIYRKADILCNIDKPESPDETVKNIIEKLELSTKEQRT